MLSDHQVVLIVENDLSTCLHVAELLEDNGFLTFTAISASEALKILNVTDNIDLLITDIDLGEVLTGFDLATTARKMFTNLPVIFVTGSTKNTSVLKRIKFLTKPYDDEALMSNVRQVLEEFKKEATS